MSVCRRTSCSLVALPLFFLPLRPPPTSTLFPYTTLFRSFQVFARVLEEARQPARHGLPGNAQHVGHFFMRSEEHTSELQSPYDLVCRLLLEKKKYTGNMPCDQTLTALA